MSPKAILASPSVQALGLFVWSLLWLLTGFAADIPFRNDDTFYLAVSQAIWSGEGYADPASPFPMNLQTCPALFPLFLGLPRWLAGDSEILLMSLLLLVTSTGPVCAYLYLKTQTTVARALLLSAAFGSHHMFLSLSDSVMTETIFVPLFYLAAWAHALEKKSAAMGLLALAARTRLVGLFFWFTHGLSAIRERRWKSLMWGMLPLMLLFALEKSWAGNGLPTFAYFDSFLVDYPLHEDPLRAAIHLLSQVWANFQGLLGSMYANLLLPWTYSWAPMSPAKRIVVLMVTAIGFWGVIRFLLRKPNWPLFIGFLLQTGLILTWGEPGTLFRYFMPFWPLLALWFLLGIEAIGNRLERSLGMRLRGEWLPLAAAFTVLINQGVYSATRDKYDPLKPLESDVAPIHLAIGENTPEDAVLLSYQPWYSWMRTGRSSLLLRYPRNLDQWLPHLESKAPERARFALVRDSDVAKWIHEGFAPERLGERIETRQGWSLYRLYSP